MENFFHRQESRIPIETNNLPFLGSEIRNQTPLIYCLLNLSPSGIGFRIKSEHTAGLSLKKGDQLNFHLPFQIDERFYSVGEIRWIKQEHAMQSVQYGAFLQRRIPLKYPIYVAYQTGDVQFKMEDYMVKSPEEFLPWILEDALYLKRGVGICLRHLFPFFGRHSPINNKRAIQKERECLEEEYTIEETKNIGMLEDVLREVSESKECHSILTPMLLNELRIAIRIESQFLEIESYFHPDAVFPYIHSIQILLNQLYINYNTLVLLYLTLHHQAILGQSIPADC